MRKQFTFRYFAYGTCSLVRLDDNLSLQKNVELTEDS